MELKDLIRYVREQRHLTQPEFAKELNVVPMTVYRWERGETEPKSDQIQRMGIEYRYDGDYGVANLRPINKADTLEVKLISREYQACAGNGNLNDGVAVEYSGTVNVTDAVLSAMYSASSLTAMYVEGDSMQPAIYNGDIVVFVEQYEVTAQGMPYIVEFRGRLAVKGVEVNKKGYLLRSANKNYEPLQITEDDNFKIIGRVVKIIPASRDPEPIF